MAELGLLSGPLEWGIQIHRGILLSLSAVSGIGREQVRPQLVAVRALLSQDVKSGRGSTNHDPQLGRGS